MTLLPFYGPSLHCTHGRSLRAALALEVPKGSANEHEQWVRIREEGKAARAFAASGAATMQAAAASSTSSAENAASGADATQAAETETTAETQATSAESATTQAVVDKHDDDSDADDDAADDSDDDWSDQLWDAIEADWVADCEARRVKDACLQDLFDRFDQKTNFQWGLGKPPGRVTRQ